MIKGRQLKHGTLTPIPFCVTVKYIIFIWFNPSGKGTE